jgi:hypothetical protein
MEANSVASEFRVVQIADVGAALRLLPEVHSDARRALAEFVANSADAFVLAERRGMHRDWRCETRLGKKDVTVADNGPGITRERLLELPSKVTLSAKVGDSQQKGHKAIGLLAYGCFCKEMRIVSRAVGESDTFEACWSAETLSKPTENPVCVRPVLAPHALKTAGTEVVLSGLVDERLHQLKAQKLVDFLSAEFSPDLRAKRYRLLVSEGKTEHRVLPGRFSGIRFPKLRVITSSGESIDLELFLTQKPLLQRVALFVRGKQIVGNLADVVEFSEGPWKSGRISGEIRCDFLRPTTGRSAIEHGAEWRRFVQAVTLIENDLRLELERIAEEQRSREATRIFKEINQALAAVLPRLKWDELPSSALGAKGQAAVFPRGSTGVGPSGGAGHASSKGKGASPISPTRTRLIDPSRTQRGAGSAATGFNYREAEFEPDVQHLRSRYISIQSLIEVNNLHSDYLTERANEAQLRNYLTRLLVKEIALLNFKDMGELEVAERIVELETALSRALA